MSPLVSRIDTIFVPALDPVAAANWYRRLFALETVFEEPDYVALRFPGDGPRDTAALTLRRTEAIDREAHPAFNFFAADPERLHAAVTAEGSEATPIESSGGMRHFNFRDISGNWINVCHF
jgi:hypothetical protein